MTESLAEDHPASKADGHDDAHLVVLDDNADGIARAVSHVAAADVQPQMQHLRMCDTHLVPQIA